MINLETTYQLPGIEDTRQTAESEVGWGRYENQLIIPLLLNGAARDAGGSPTTVLRPGLLLGRVASTGKVKEWTPAATDGSELILGAMLYDQNMQVLATDKDRFAYVLAGGLVKAGALIVPGATARGIDGKAEELRIRFQLSQTGRFRLDDEMHGNPYGGWQRVVAKTADYTVVEADNNTIFTNEGAAGAVNFTLPTVRVGFRFLFVVVADQTLKVIASPADSMIAFNDNAADSVSLETASEKVGGVFEILGISATKWVVMPHLWDSGVVGAQVVTIVT